MENPRTTRKRSFWLVLTFLKNSGETYAAIDLHTNDEVAIKIEKLDNKKMVLRLEVIALKKLQGFFFIFLFFFRSPNGCEIYSFWKTRHFQLSSYGEITR
jgi:hypothetical protein